MTAATRITLATRINNPDLPILGDLAKMIADDPRVTGFFTAHFDLMTIQAGGSYQGLVSVMENRKTGSALVLSEAVSTAMPSYDEDGGPNGRGALRFFTSGSDKLTASVAAVVSGDFFKVVIFKSPGSTSNQYLLYSGTSDDRHMLQLGQYTPGPIPNYVLQRAGASADEAMAQVPFTPNEWQIAIGTWNDAANTVGLSLQNADFVTDTSGAAIVDQTAMIVSGGTLANDTLVSDIIYGTCDLTSAANEDLLAKILDYARDVCGLDI